MNSILNENDSSMLANAINHYQSIQHQEQLNLIIAKQEMLFAETYKLIPFKDGNEWCVLLGDDLQVGIAGFGDTPIKAIRDFNNNFIYGLTNTK